MSETTSGFEPGAAGADEAAAVATLHRLNADYIRAFVESDAAWYREHLSHDFVCTLADGRRIDREEFLRLNAEGPGVTDVWYDEIDVSPMGDVALVRGVTHYTRDDAPASTRYTDVWRLLDGRWQAVAAQLTRVAAPSAHALSARRRDASRLDAGG